MPRCFVQSKNWNKTKIILLVGSIYFTNNNMEGMAMSASTGKLVPIYNVDTNKEYQ